MRYRMFKIFMVLSLLTMVLFAENNETQKATQLEMFMFKIGFTSLLNDMNNTKNTTNTNKEDIEQLNKKVDYIIAQLNQMKFEQKSDLTLGVGQSIQNQSPSYTIRANGVNIRKIPFITAKIIGQLAIGQKIQISYCNQYGWCKLKNQDGYVAKFLLEKK